MKQLLSAGPRRQASARTSAVCVHVVCVRACVRVCVCVCVCVCVLVCAQGLQ